MQFRSHQLFIALAATFALQAQAATDPAAPVSVIPGIPATTAPAPTTATAPATSPTVSTTTTASSDRIQSSNLVSDYTTWAGSPANSQSLVNGLHSGTPVTLQSAGSSTTTDAVTFSTPTQNMGWGSVSKALSLAEANLAAMGITNPTPQQIQTALTGGTITTIQGTTTQTTQVNGVLTMRNQGMGWGQIAQKLNLQPGATFKPSRVENHVQEQHHSEDHHEELHHHSDFRDSSHKHIESSQHDSLHHAATTGTPQTSAHRITTAAGGQGHTMRAETRHGSDYQQAHLDHTPVARVVTAAGAPISAGPSLSHASHSDNHVEIHQVSHITTAAGGQAFAGGGHGSEGNHGHH